MCGVFALVDGCVCLTLSVLKMLDFYVWCGRCPQIVMRQFWLCIKPQ